MAARDVAAAVAHNLVGHSKRKAGRKTLLRQKGQILVIDPVRFKQILSNIFVNPRINTAQLNAIWKDWSAWLDELLDRSSVSKDRKKELREEIFLLRNNGKIGAHEDAFAIGSYKVVANNKTANKTLGTIIKYRFKEWDGEGGHEYLAKNDITRIGGTGGSGGGVLGHEEAGRGVANAGTAALKAEQMIKADPRLTTDERSRLLEGVVKFKEDIKVSIEHDMMLDDKGKFKNSYTPILTWQSETTNSTYAQKEAAALESLNQYYSDPKWATEKGSTPLVDAVGLVLFSAVSPKKKRKSVRVTGEKKKVIKERSTGSKQVQTKGEKKIAYRREAGLAAKSLSKMKSRKKKARAISPFSYMAMINKKLSQTVRKNMGPPGFQNQSGRFANSVKVQDVNMTKQGHPSFGYTYAKNPYQVFEVGEGAAPWATSQRDPRKLIDKSIREVAAELAIGRFYTRRL